MTHRYMYTIFDKSILCMSFFGISSCKPRSPQSAWAILFEECNDSPASIESNMSESRPQREIEIDKDGKEDTKTERLFLPFRDFLGN